MGLTSSLSKQTKIKQALKHRLFWASVFIMNECMCLSFPNDGYQQVAHRLPITILHNFLDCYNEQLRVY